MLRQNATLSASKDILSKKNTNLQSELDKCRAALAESAQKQRRMEEDHARELAGVDNRFSTMQQFHNAELESMKSKLRQMADELTSVRKITNEVSIRIRQATTLLISYL